MIDDKRQDPTYRRAVVLAHELADASGAMIRRYFRRRGPGPAYRDKADCTPVTQTDRDIEMLWRRRIIDRFPDHGLIGEEYARQGGKSRWQWALDPIDGTLSFIIGKPLCGSLIALIHDDDPVYGVIDHPLTGERWHGGIGDKAHMTRAHGTKSGMETAGTIKGSGAIKGGDPSRLPRNADNGDGWRPDNGKRVVEPCRSRTQIALGDAVLCATSPHMFGTSDFDRFDRLRRCVKYVSYGSDCYAYGLLAGGWVDIVAESDMKIADCCALAAVVKAAGGTITDWDGEPLSTRLTTRSGPDIDAARYRVLACGDGALHRRALDVLGHAGQKRR